MTSSGCSMKEFVTLKLFNAGNIGRPTHVYLTNYQPVDQITQWRKCWEHEKSTKRPFSADVTGSEFTSCQPYNGILGGKQAQCVDPARGTVTPRAAASMPHFCSVFGCANRGNRDKKSFFRFPKIISHQGAKTEEISRQRLTKWLASIARSDLTCENVHSRRVCSDHFVSGKLE